MEGYTNLRGSDILFNFFKKIEHNYKVCYIFMCNYIQIKLGLTSGMVEPPFPNLVGLICIVVGSPSF